METVKRSFIAARQLRLHQRAIDCLDMIVSAEKILANAQDYLNRYDKAKWTDLIQIVNRRHNLEANVHKYERIIARLTKWYRDIMNRINLVNLDTDLQTKISENY